MSTSIPDFKLGVASDPTPGFGSDITLVPVSITAVGSAPSAFTLQSSIVGYTAVDNQAIVVNYKFGILPEGPVVVRLQATATVSSVTLVNTTGSSVYLLSKTGGYSTIANASTIIAVSNSTTPALVYRIAENMFLAL